MTSTVGSMTSTTYLGNVGYNWHGSYPVFVADAKFEPNFRMFNMVSDVSLSNEDLHTKLLTDDDGVARQPMGHVAWRMRGWPVMYSSVVMGITSAFFVSRFDRMRNTSHTLWLPARHIAGFFIIGNCIRYWQRERTFNSDFERNQYFAYDEIKARRDEERVRKAIDDKQYVNDPLTEYRVKAWQVSRSGL